MATHRRRPSDAERVMANLPASAHLTCVDGLVAGQVAFVAEGSLATVALVRLLSVDLRRGVPGALVFGEALWKAKDAASAPFPSRYRRMRREGGGVITAARRRELGVSAVRVGKEGRGRHLPGAVATARGAFVAAAREGQTLMSST